jgi:hypothetical protein
LPDEINYFGARISQDQTEIIYESFLSEIRVFLASLRINKAIPEEA